VFPSLCPLKSRGEVFKNGFQIFQLRIAFGVAAATPKAIRIPAIGFFLNLREFIKE